MRTRLTLQPGQSGTKALVEQYGDRLVCVRYRYDAPLRRRIKTVELVVEEAPWEPPIAPETMMTIQVEVDERGMQQQVKQAGGRWLPERKAWALRYDQVQALGLASRIVGRLENAI